MRSLTRLIRQFSSETVGVEELESLGVARARKLMTICDRISGMCREYLRYRKGER